MNALHKKRLNQVCLSTLALISLSFVQVHQAKADTTGVTGANQPAAAEKATNVTQSTAATIKPTTASAVVGSTSAAVGESDGCVNADWCSV